MIQFETIERRYQAALQKAGRAAPTLESATLLAGMLLCNAGALAVAGQVGVEIVARSNAELELVSIALDRRPMCGGA